MDKKAAPVTPLRELDELKRAIEEQCCQPILSLRPGYLEFVGAAKPHQIAQPESTHV